MNRIPTKSPWWHLSEEEFIGLCEAAILPTVLLCILILVIA